MQLMKVADVTSDFQEQVFRYSPLRTSWRFYGLCAIPFVLWFANRHKGAPDYVVAAALSVLVFRRFLLAPFRRFNWLVRMTNKGLFVQFRSYLNYDLSAEDQTVAYFSYPEIGSAHLIQERRNFLVSGRYGIRPKTQNRSLVELRFKAESPALEGAIAAEFSRRPPRWSPWYGFLSLLYFYYPGRMSAPDCLQIEWTASPGAEAFLEALRTYVEIKEPNKISRDYCSMASLAHEEQERNLQELAQSGQYRPAVLIAQKLHSCDLSNAKAFVDKLLDLESKGSLGVPKS